MGLEVRINLGYFSLGVVLSRLLHIRSATADLPDHAQFLAQLPWRTQAAAEAIFALANTLRSSVRPTALLLGKQLYRKIYLAWLSG